MFHLPFAWKVLPAIWTLAATAMFAVADLGLPAVEQVVGQSIIVAITIYCTRYLLSTRKKASDEIVLAKDSRIADQDAHIDSLKARVQDLIVELTHKDDAIARKDAELALKDAQIVDLKKALSTVN